MYIVEKKDGSEAARWNNLRNKSWPDGSSFSGVWDIADSKAGEDGETYTVKEVVKKIEGKGPRVLSVSAPTKVGKEWRQITKMGAALPPPPTPKPGDEGYDHRPLRKREYADTMPFGDQADAILKWTTAIRVKKSALDDAIDGMDSMKDADKTALKAALGPVFDLPSDLDAIVDKWAAVKSKFPKSE